MRYSSPAWWTSFRQAVVAGAGWSVIASAHLSATEPGGANDPGTVSPPLRASLLWHFDFDHPDATRAEHELDQGPSGTYLELVNGGDRMRVEDNAWAGSGHALQTAQQSPEAQGNDDWKAGRYELTGVDTLGRCGGATGLTLMGWFKVSGPVPAPNSYTPRADDFYPGAGLVGILSGGSDGHFCRALLEILQVDGELRVVALGRRVDGGATQMGIWDSPWQEVLPAEGWTHLAAVFDYAAGTIAVYRNGVPAPVRLYQKGNPWAGSGIASSDRTSETLPAGIKVGGSYPQNNRERNPFNGRMDDLMAFDRALDAAEIQAQFARFSPTPVP